MPHPQGILDEYEYFKQAVPDQAFLDARLAEAEVTVRERFKAGNVNNGKIENGEWKILVQICCWQI